MTIRTQKTTGLLFILGAAGVIVPYLVLTVTFDYPAILRKDAGEVLTNFHRGGAGLIVTWWSFAILGLPMLVAYIQLGKLLDTAERPSSWWTSVGVIGLVAQMAGLLRWTFVVPAIAERHAVGEPLQREIAKAVFQTVHQYGGVAVGEHLGQLFTVIWMIAATIALGRLRATKKWLCWFGGVSAIVYLLAQAEVFVTVIPVIPVWDFAGALGSTLWLIWIAALGTSLLAGTTSPISRVSMRSRRLVTTSGFTRIPGESSRG